MNYFYFFFFLFLSLLLWVKPLIIFICKKIDQAQNLNILGGLTFLIGMAMVIFSINSAWAERLWILLTLIVGILLCIRGLVVIFFLEKIKKILPLYLNHYYKFSIPISAVMISLALFTVSTDYIGPQKNISECKSDDAISVICGVSNPEDIVVTPDNKYLLISEFGGIRPYDSTKSGGFALLRLSDNKIITPKISFGKNIWGEDSCKQNEIFGPHGIDLVQREDGSYQLGVINHYPGETIEMFELVQKSEQDTWSFVWRGCVEVPEKYYLNDVALKKDGTFYVSHMYSRDITMTKWLITALFKKDSGVILEWNKDSFIEIPNSEGSGPNGITLNELTNNLFISYNQGDRVVKFDLSDNKKLQTFKVESPDNIYINKDSVWLTSLDFQPNDAGDCIERPACSLPFSIYEIDRETFVLKNENSFNKTVFGLPTIAVPIDNTIFMGSFHSDRLGYFTQK
jgi:DNA-binding beta-propeller fold protein YncE